MGTLRELQRTTLGLWILTGLLFVATCFLLSYYPLAKTFRFDYCHPDADNCGVLSSQRFRTYDWWKTSLFVLAIVPLFWVGVMISTWKAQWPKTVFLVFLALSLLWWAAVLVIDVLLMIRANDPTVSLDNPADDYRRCGTPEWFLVDVTCDNFGSATPDWTPPVSLSDLSVNGDFVFAFAYAVVYLVSWIVYIVLTVRFWRLVKQLKENGGDTTTRTVTIVDTNTPAYVPVPMGQKVTHRAKAAASAPPSTSVFSADGSTPGKYE